MDEKQLAMTSVAGSVISLIAIYIIVSSMGPGDVNIGQITAEHAGKAVKVTGIIVNMDVKDGNAFFTLADGTGEIRVVLWEGILRELERDGLDTSMLRDNVKISVEGEVDVYRGQLEIVPTRPRITVIG